MLRFMLSVFSSSEGDDYFQPDRRYEGFSKAFTDTSVVILLWHIGNLSLISILPSLLLIRYRGKIKHNVFFSLVLLGFYFSTAFPFCASYQVESHK